MTDAFRDDLVEARTGTNATSGRQRSTRKKVTRLRAVDVTLQGFCVVEPADEHHAIPIGRQRSKHLAQLHVLAFALGKPLVSMKTTAGK